jgi:methionyl-tRNA formyltransferase
MQLRIVFMGSPDFAVPSLQKLSDEFQIVGVFTQPDRPAGRGRKLRPSAVKVLASQLGLPIFHPERVRSNPTVMEKLQSWQPDLIVVAAYAQILPQTVLDFPKFGCINVHASLLPRWRGASPIQAAIATGDPETGITIMKMDAGLDTGDILAQRKEPIHRDDTAATLETRLSKMGSQLLVETIPGFVDGRIEPVPQQGEHTYARMLKKEDGKLDFSRSVTELERIVRAYNPWPGAFIIMGGERFKIHKASIVEEKEISQPGKKEVIHDFPAIACSDGWLKLDIVQPAGGKAMDGKAYLHGAHEWTGFCEF